MMNNAKFRYIIVRSYPEKRMERILRTRVTFEHAKEHCSNPEANSKFCKKPANKQRTSKMGPWADTFRLEPIL